MFAPFLVSGQPTLAFSNPTLVDTDTGHLYRFDNVLTASMDTDGDPPFPPPNVKIVLNCYPIVKETPCGAWIDLGYDTKWVNLNAKKRFACRTKQEALESFLARKRRQIRLLSNQLRNSKEALNLGVAMKDDVEEAVDGKLA